MSKLKKQLKNLIFDKSKLGEPDWPLIIVVSIILLFGLIMLTSASGTMAYSRYGDGYYFLKHQVLAILIGAGLFWYFAKTDYQRWKKYSFYLLIFSIILLILVFIPGLASSANFKARSWISILGYSFQPAEFVKLSFLIYLAAWLESRAKKTNDVSQDIWSFLIVLGIIGGLMLLQPDIGTLAIITLTSLIAYFVGGGKVIHILTIIFVGLMALVLMIKVMPYQAKRFNCYSKPEISADKDCYQLNQSLIAVGSGGIWGRGFGASRQKLMYLPEVSGDSIFPVIGEELGFIFSVLLIILFLILFYRGYIIAIHSPDHFGKVLALGISSWLVAQAFINIGGMIDFMPMTGVPLPFISSGGSAIMATMAAIGILTNISRHARN